MDIRTMLIEDYQEVYQLWSGTAGMGLNSIDDNREGIERYLNRNPRTCLVATSQNRIIGAILSGHDGRRGFIYHTAVSEAEQRQGTGSALVAAALAALSDEGITKVALVVFAGNAKGNRFWEKNGFSQREDLVYRNAALRESVRLDT